MPITMEPNPQLNSPAFYARRTLIEILTVLSMTVLPNLIYSAVDYFFHDPSIAPANGSRLLLQQFMELFRLAIPVLFIMWISGKNFRHFGFTVLHPLDVVYGIGILIGSLIFHTVVWIALSALAPVLVNNLSQVTDQRITQTFAQVHGDIAKLLLLAACFLVGFTEELIFRAYLLTRLTDLTGSKSQALFLSSLLFAFAHIYQGALGIISAALFAVFYGSIFLLTRRFWPLAIAHALTDFISLLAR